MPKLDTNNAALHFQNGKVIESLSLSLSLSLHHACSLCVSMLVRLQLSYFKILTLRWRREAQLKSRWDSCSYILYQTWKRSYIWPRRSKRKGNCIVTVLLCRAKVEWTRTGWRVRSLVSRVARLCSILSRDKRQQARRSRHHSPTSSWPSQYPQAHPILDLRPHLPHPIISSWLRTDHH